MRRLSALVAVAVLLGGCATAGSAGSPRPSAAASPASPSVSAASAPSPSPTPVSITSLPTSAPEGAVVLAAVDNAQVEIVSPAGQRVLIDVWNPDLLSRPPTSNDVLLTTHSHEDHYVAAFVASFPGRKLTFETGHIVTGDVDITGVAAAHNEGDDLVAKGGTDYIYIVRTAGMTIAHFGDLGQDRLTETQLAALGHVDVAISQLTNDVSNVTYANRKGFTQMTQVRPTVLIPTHIMNDPVATAKEAATLWKATYTTKPYVTLRRSALPDSTTVLYMGPNASAFGKISSAALVDW